MNRFDRNDWFFFGALACLFAGVWLKCDLGTALIVLGSIETVVSTATAFFVTGLSTRIGKK